MSHKGRFLVDCTRAGVQDADRLVGFFMQKQHELTTARALKIVNDAVQSWDTTKTTPGQFVSDIQAALKNLEYQEASV